MVKLGNRWSGTPPHLYPFGAPTMELRQKLFLLTPLFTSIFFSCYLVAGVLLIGMGAVTFGILVLAIVGLYWSLIAVFRLAIQDREDRRVLIGMLVRVVEQDGPTGVVTL